MEPVVEGGGCWLFRELVRSMISSCGNFRTISEQIILPTMVVSENLTNSMHCDTNDDARSFSLFYPILPNAQTLFLFPTIGLCIDISSPVIICWDGRVAQHGSYTTAPGIHSLFGEAMKNVSVRTAIEKAYQEKGYCNDLVIGEEVYVRRRLPNMDHDDSNCVNMKQFSPNVFMNRRAVVKSIDGPQVTVRYVGKLSKLKDIPFKRRNVCKLKYVYKYTTNIRN